MSKKSTLERLCDKGLDDNYDIYIDRFQQYLELVEGFLIKEVATRHDYFFKAFEDLKDLNR